MIAKLAKSFALSIFEITPFQCLHFIGAHCDSCDVTLLHCSTNNSMPIATMDGGKGEIDDNKCNSTFLEVLANHRHRPLFYKI